jgi:hypothetical protein
MDNPKVIVKRTKKFGDGVFAQKPLTKGEVIAEFDGPIYGDDTVWTDETADHSVQFDQNQWRDSDGIARCLNHSCEPNCGIRGLFSIVAMRDIAAGEELVWDYDMTEDAEPGDWDMKCRCGTPSCRGTIGAYRNLPLPLQKRYRAFTSQWLLKKYSDTSQTKRPDL